MKKYHFFLSILISITLGAEAKAELAKRTNDEIKNAFPKCDIGEPIVGSLYTDNEEDIVVKLTCHESEKEYYPLSYKVLVLAKSSDSVYSIKNQTKELGSEGVYDFSLQIKKKSLFFHFSIPGSQTANIIDYQFKYDGKSLILVGMELDSYYHGEEKQKHTDYHISTNFLTGKVIDSHVKGGNIKRTHLEKITIEDFYTGFGS